MASYCAAEAGGRMEELVSRALSGEKITLSASGGNAVIISEDEWDAVVETLFAAMAAEAPGRFSAESA